MFFEVLSAAAPTSSDYLHLLSSLCRFVERDVTGIWPHIQDNILGLWGKIQLLGTLK
jgi:hypothetical protein